MHLRRLARLLVLLPVFSLPLAAQDDEPEIRSGPAIDFVDAFPGQEPFDRPLFVDFHATDPAMAYVVTQAGHVWRVPRQGDSAGASGQREAFLDFSERVLLKNWEEGLLGFQFDPDYAQNGHVYVYWSEEIEPREVAMPGGKSRKSNRQSVISRFTAPVQGDRGRIAVDPASEVRLLEVFQPFGNHNGGTIVFGPDGMLYIAIGDGGYKNDPYGNSESLTTLLGKIMRIDVRNTTLDEPYRIPADNPFVDRDGARGEIWAYGLRNVWRMAFDRDTGELWAGDVGQNRIEEVVHVTRGGFYGWNSFEGTEEFGQRRSRRETPADPIPPVAEYSHREGLSITGGHVYRGQKIPGLVGHFVYADFVTKRTWAVKTTGEHEVVTLKHCPFPPSSFAEEPDGELLVTCFVGNKGKIGRIYRLVPAAR
ncbi:MAG: PQQ-dependent sugar dehydrogenase [bacterium]|nr:PQQ-dependent sugar dehydrogenase [bacterium]